MKMKTIARLMPLLAAGLASGQAAAAGFQLLEQNASGNSWAYREGDSYAVKDKTALCRCGHSANKPYCDGSHVEGGFVASGEREAKASQPLAMRDGGLDVEPQKDGPLHVIGNLEVVTGTGHTVDRTTETWLCRCGHSANKPFCDGTHAKIGFKADGV